MLSSVCATADQYSIASLQTPPQFLRYSLAPLTCEKDLWDTWTPALGAVCPRGPATVQPFNLVSGFTPSDGGIYHQQVDFTQLLSAQCEDVLFPSGLLQVHECHFDHEDPQQPDHSEATAALFLYRLLGAVELLQPVPAGASMWSGFHNSPQSAKILEAGGFEYKLGMLQPKATQADPVTVIKNTESSHRLSASSGVRKHRQPVLQHPRYFPSLLKETFR